MARRRPFPGLWGGAGAAPAWDRGLGLARRSFAPYQPPPIPAGSYDPALDAARRAASRGLGDVTADTETANTRDTVDYGVAREGIVRDQTRGNADIDRNVSMLQRSYERLGGQQRQSIAASGLGYGPAALEAASKRAANEAIDQQPLDTARARLGEDTTLRLGALDLQMAPPGEGNPLGGRRFQDRTTTMTRAQREDVNFGLDTEGQKAYQAAGVGYVPPGRGEPGGVPRNEFVDAQGNPFRTIRSGNEILRVNQAGQVLSRRRRRGR